MSVVDVPLETVLHLLPPSSRMRLEVLVDRGVQVRCTAVIVGNTGTHQLTATVAGRTVRTGQHRWISPGLVTDLCERLDSLLGMTG